MRGFSIFVSLLYLEIENLAVKVCFSKNSTLSQKKKIYIDTKRSSKTQIKMVEHIKSYIYIYIYIPAENSLFLF